MTSTLNVNFAAETQYAAVSGDPASLKKGRQSPIS